VASEGGEERFRVEVLRRDRITVYPKLRQPLRIYRVTYVAEDLPPATIDIPVDEWSLEREMQLVREDIERRLEFKPETYVV